MKQTRGLLQWSIQTFFQASNCSIVLYCPVIAAVPSLLITVRVFSRLVRVFASGIPSAFARPFPLYVEI